MLILWNKVLRKMVENPEGEIKTKIPGQLFCGNVFLMFINMFLR